MIRPVLLILAAALASALSVHAKKKPNVLFIFADDQCFETIASLGLTDIETPNLDRLAASGATFTRAYNMGSWSGAVCVASRHMLNTGRFLWHANEASKKAEQERAAGRFWSENMKKAGYQTYFTGKWHVRASADKCFNVARNVRPGMPNQTPAGYNRPLARKARPVESVRPEVRRILERRQALERHSGRRCPRLHCPSQEARKGKAFLRLRCLQCSS